MSDHSIKLRAFCLSAILVLSMVSGVVVLSGSGVAYTKSSDPVTLDPSPSVNVTDATIDPSNESEIEVAVNVSGEGLQPSEIQVQAEIEEYRSNPNVEESVNTTLLSDADFASNASTGNITLATSVADNSFKLNVTAYNANTGQPIPGAVDNATIIVDDTTAPDISNVQFSNDGFDKFQVSFESSEQVGDSAGNLSVQVTGPNGATYTFDRFDFFLSDSSGNYTYQLNKLQSFDDGSGTYSLSINAAEDGSGNDGQASAPSATHDYTTDFSDKTVTNQAGGPNLDTNNVTMFTMKVQNQFLFIRLENDTSSFDRRDLAGEGATTNSELWVNFTVDSFNPDVLMGTANVDSWNYTMNGDGSANVNVSLTPSSTERNFSAWQNGVSDPTNWGSQYDGSDLSTDAVVDFGIANLSGVNAPQGLDGARLTTDAQAYNPPKLDSNGNLSIEVASPHCVESTAPPANQCSGDEVNDGGFYEAVIPSAFYQQEWGASQLSSDDVDVSYSSSSSGGSNAPSWEISVRNDGALVINGTNLHYSDGTVNIAQSEDDSGSSDSDDDSGGGGSGVDTSVSSSQTDDGTTATINGVKVDDPTALIDVEGASTSSIQVDEASVTFDQGSNRDTTVSVSASEVLPVSAPDPPGGDPLSYVTVDVTGSLAGQVSEGSFTIDLADSDVDPARVTAHRYHDGEWQEVDIAVVGETTVEVVTPGFSVFAISESGPAAQVTATSTMTATPTAASTASPTATSQAAPTETPTPRAESTPVATQSTTATTAARTQSDGMPGFTVGTALIALFVVVIWTSRRYR